MEYPQDIPVRAVNLNTRFTLEREGTGTYDTLLRIGWEGGTIVLQLVDMPREPGELSQSVSEVMAKFNHDCSLILLAFLALPNGVHFSDEDQASGEPFVLEDEYPDIGVIPIVQLSQQEVTDAFAPRGQLETLLAEAFVVFAYQRWETSIRPAIAEEAGVDPKHVVCPLLGELRLLRNWVVHPCEDTERKLFDDAGALVDALGLKPGEITIDRRHVHRLKARMNSLYIIINPNDVEPGIRLHRFTEEERSQIQRGFGPDEYLMPETPRLPFHGEGRLHG